MWTYSQSSGKMYHDGVFFALGYSGIAAGLNNPNMQSVKNIGPLPRGLWTIGPYYDHPHLGPVTMNLYPHPETNTYDRSDFRIHADLRLYSGQHLASHGCIILIKPERLIVAASLDRELECVI
jgi:hypothetical protein